MAPPWNKKQKTSDNQPTFPMPPVIFKSRNLKPDVRLKVFGKEFHVHSVVLKMHSTYFLKLIEPVENRQSTTSSSIRFPYEYISIADDDGEWSLEPPSIADVTSTDKPLKDELKTEDEREAFEKIINAMYGMTYEIKDISQLEAVTRLADFYRALPIVSLTLYKALPISNTLISEIAQNSSLVLRLAKKLRNPPMIREALIHVAGDYKMWETLGKKKPFEDDDLNCIAFKAYSHLCTLKLKADFEISELCYEDRGACDIIYEEDRPDGPQRGAIYYRVLLARLKEHRDDLDVEDAIGAIKALLQSNLVLERRTAGKYHRDQITFYCADIEDEDMPWDPTETDW